MQFARRLILLICYYKVTDDDTVDSGAFGLLYTGGDCILFQIKLHPNIGLMVNKQWLHQQTELGINVHVLVQCIHIVHHPSVNGDDFMHLHIQNCSTIFFRDKFKVWLQTITTSKLWSCLLYVYSSSHLHWITFNAN